MEVVPVSLRSGDAIRFVSPASTPTRASLARQARIFESWGLKVEYAKHTFDEYGFLAGTDADRIADLNEAIRDPKVRAIVASRGGKGSYRIADQLDFEALRRDPKFLVGFSDITALHFAIWNQCQLVGLHGGLFDGYSGEILANTQKTLRSALMEQRPIRVVARDDEPTSALTTTGMVTGRLLGGNLDIMGTSAGWLLPDLRDAIVLLEAVEMGPGLADRMLMMLRKNGHFEGASGVAVGQFEKFKIDAPISIIDLLREHLSHLDVPILGGLPIGHGYDPVTVPVGRFARLDADGRYLEIGT